MQLDDIVSSVPGSSSRTHRRAVVVGWIVLLGVLAGGFLFAPFNEDVRSQFAAARQADYRGWFPGNIVEAWDIKPIGNRMMIYGFYRAAANLVAFRDKPTFELFVHGLCLGGIMVGLAVVRRVIQGSPGSDARVSPISIGLGLVSILAVSYYVILQPEWFASLLLLAAIGLTVSESPIAAVAAGLVASVLLPLKGVTVLLVPIVPVTWLLMGLDWRRRSLPFLGGLVLGFALTVFVFVLYPQSWQDLVDATAYQNSVGGFAPVRRGLKTIGVGFGGAMTHAPMLYVGISCTLLVAVAGIARRSFSDTLLLLAAWGCAVAVVMIQGKWFAYHYGVAIVPALLSVATWCSDRYSAWRESLPMTGRWKLVALACLGNLVLAAITWRYAPDQRGMLPSVCVVMAILVVGLVQGDRFARFWGAMPTFVALLTGIGWACLAAPWTPPARSAALAGAEQLAYFSGLDGRHRLSEEPSLLFLEAGEASYFITPRSALRWIYPLPLQRVHSNPELVRSAVHVRALEQALAYEGQYIILDATWMRSDQRLLPALSEKIEREYEVVDATNLLQDHGEQNSYVLLRRR